MQKLTTRQALAAVLAIWDAWQPAPGDEPSQVMLRLSASVRAMGYADADTDDMTDAGRAMLAEAPRTAEQEALSVLESARCAINLPDYFVGPLDASWQIGGRCVHEEHPTLTAALLRVAELRKEDADDR